MNVRGWGDAEGVMLEERIPRGGGYRPGKWEREEGEGGRQGLMEDDE